VHCPKCGTESPEDSLFCRKCGAALSAQTEGAKTAGAQPNHRNKSIALSLAIALVISITFWLGGVLATQSKAIAILLA